MPHLYTNALLTQQFTFPTRPEHRISKRPPTHPSSLSNGSQGVSSVPATRGRYSPTCTVQQQKKGHRIDREVMTNVAANCCHPSHDQWDVQVNEDVVAITGDGVPGMGIRRRCPSRTTHFMATGDPVRRIGRMREAGFQWGVCLPVDVYCNFRHSS